MIATLLRFARTSKGNVSIIFAISLVPLVYLTGMGIDYSSAALREEQLNAIADAASLAAVTPSLMESSDSASITAATNAFNAQASAITGITYNSANLTVTVADTITNRTVTVTYTAASENFFPDRIGPVDYRTERNIASSRRLRPEYQFLPVARQFAVDGASGHVERHQHHGDQHAIPVRFRPGRRLDLRLRVRLPRIASVVGDLLQFHKMYPLRNRQSRRRGQLRIGESPRPYVAYRQSGDRDRKFDEHGAIDRNRE